MTGTLTSVASLIICLGMATTSAFVVWVPKVTPLPDPAWTKQASSSLGGPLGDDGDKMGADHAFSWVRRRSTCPLHVFKGVEPDIIEDDNATIPIVGGIGGEEGRNSGVTSGHQDETVVQHRITVTMEELSVREHFFGEDMSVTVIASAAHESTSTSQQEERDGVNTHGVSDDSDATIEENLATNADIAADFDITTDAGDATDADIVADAHLTTDDDLELLQQEQLPREDSSDPVNDEGRGVTSDGTALDKVLPFELTADGVDSVVSIVMEGVFDDAMGPASYDIDGGALYDDLSFDLADTSLIDEMSIWPFDPEVPDRAAEDFMGSVAHDNISHGPMSKAVVFDGDMGDLVWSMLHDALTRGLSDPERLILDDFVDHLMWTKLHDATSGQVTSELADACHDMITCLLHNAFFGQAASEAVFSLAKTADDSQLVVDDYVLAVAELYDQIKEARYRRTTDRATADVAEGADTLRLGDAVDDAVGSVPHDIDDSLSDEGLPIDLAAYGLVDKMGIWPFDPGMRDDAAADEVLPVLYDTGDEAFYEDLRSALDAYGFDDEMMSIWPFDTGMAEHGGSDGITSALYDTGDEAFYEDLRSALDAYGLDDEMMSIWPFDSWMEEHEGGDEIAFELYDTVDKAFYEDLRSALDAYGVVDEMMNIWPFDPWMTEHAGGDEVSSALYGDNFDGAVSEPVGLDDLVNDLVLSVMHDALARGTAPKDLTIDAATDNRMWSKLREAIAGRAASDPENLADALDAVVTCLLHDTFFGQGASETVSALAKSADDSQLVVDDYVRAVTELYDDIKEARSPKPDRKADVVQKSGKGLGGWVKKLWRRIRRKER